MGKEDRDQWIVKCPKCGRVNGSCRHVSREDVRRIVRLLKAGVEVFPADEDDVTAIPDERLALVFTCCHPALSPPTRVALALRTLCGLSPAQIAGVLLTTEVATTKRLTRARQKIAAARIPYRVPAEDELPDRSWPGHTRPTVPKRPYVRSAHGYDTGHPPDERRERRPA